MKYKTEGARVYGGGTSYNLTNKITAVELCNTLNNYEKTLENLKQTEEKLDAIQKSIIQIQLSLGILTDDIHRLREVMDDD